MKKRKPHEVDATKLERIHLVKKNVQGELEDDEDAALIGKIRDREGENNPLISHDTYWEVKK